MLKLACVNCGAPLEIGPDLDVFACGFCGSQQQVQRQGGVVALKRVETAIKAVQRGTDRTAAELAMPRLNAELASLLDARSAAIAQAKEKIESVKRGRKKLALVAFAVVVFGGGMFAVDGGPGVTLVWSLTSVLLPVFVFRMVKLPEDQSGPVIAAIDERIAKIKTHINANRAILEELPT